jgi:hypothetical protein
LLHQRGLFLGRTPLIERRAGGYAVRPRADLERLLGRAYQGEINLDRLLPGFRVVAVALDEKNLCLAQIAAVQLRVPDLPDEIARRGMEAEDLLIKGARGEDRLARTGWDPAEHPRAGVPPNPGWFAPTDGSGAAPPTQVAQNEEDERAPEETLDPEAPVRQAQWDARIATCPRSIRVIHSLPMSQRPDGCPVRHTSTPSTPRSTRRKPAGWMDKVMPGGTPIGAAGSNPDIRELPGDTNAARELFDYLRVGGTSDERDPNTTVVKLPGGAGYITFRLLSRSGDSAIDVNVPGITLKRIHFP